MNFPLPVELQDMILYKFGGLQHKMVPEIKEAIEVNREYGNGPGHCMYPSSTAYGNAKELSRWAMHRPHPTAGLITDITDHGWSDHFTAHRTGTEYHAVRLAVYGTDEEQRINTRILLKAIKRMKDEDSIKWFKLLVKEFRDATQFPYPPPVKFA